ncbi:glycerate kinase [Vibrio lentus]|nr:glycerate kinase [Vibrio lentus]
MPKRKVVLVAMEPVHSRTGYGAAGGTPMGLGLLFNMQIKPGIEMVLGCFTSR